MTHPMDNPQGTITSENQRVCKGVNVYCVRAGHAMNKNNDKNRCFSISNYHNKFDDSDVETQYSNDVHFDSAQSNPHTECQGVERAATECLITYKEYCHFNGTDFPTYDPPMMPESDFRNAAMTFYKGIYNSNDKAQWCTDIQEDVDEGYSPNWAGNYCGAKGNENSTTRQRWIECDLHYPLIRIRDLLKMGAEEFPHAEFEKKSPTTMIMVRFDQKCNERYHGMGRGVVSPTDNISS